MKIGLWQLASGLGVGAFIAALFYGVIKRFGQRSGQGFQTSPISTEATAIIGILIIMIFGGITVVGLVLYAPHSQSAASERVAKPVPTPGSPLALPQASISGSLFLLQEELRPIYFPDYSTELSDDARERLNRYAVLITKAQRKIIIEGHSHPVDPGANIPAGTYRASAVANYLKKLGVPSELMTVVNFGGERPLSSTIWKYNNRVEFKVIPE